MFFQSLEASLKGLFRGFAFVHLQMLFRKPTQDSFSEGLFIADE
jgi:hypothetical protein